MGIKMVVELVKVLTRQINYKKYCMDHTVWFRQYGTYINSIYLDNETCYLVKIFCDKFHEEAGLCKRKVMECQHMDLDMF